LGYNRGAIRARNPKRHLLRVPRPVLHHKKELPWRSCNLCWEEPAIAKENKFRFVPVLTVDEVARQKQHYTGAPNASQIRQP
jgi:hypothetical protein